MGRLRPKFPQGAGSSTSGQAALPQTILLKKASVAPRARAKGANMLTEYIRGAVQLAEYKKLEDGTHYGEIPPSARGLRQRAGTGGLPRRVAERARRLDPVRSGQSGSLFRRPPGLTLPSRKLADASLCWLPAAIAMGPRQPE